MSDTPVSDPLCERCDYGPNHDADGCRGWRDPDEPCRITDPSEYDEEATP